MSRNPHPEVHISCRPFSSQASKQSGLMRVLHRWNLNRWHIRAPPGHYKPGNNEDQQQVVSGGGGCSTSSVSSSGRSATSGDCNIVLNGHVVQLGRRRNSATIHISNPLICELVRQQSIIREAEEQKARNPILRSLRRRRKQRKMASLERRIFRQSNVTSPQ